MTGSAIESVESVSAAEDVSTVTTAIKLLRCSELVGITVYELRAQRAANQPESLPDQRDVAASWQVLEKHHPRQMECRFRFTVTDVVAEYFADIAAVYAFDRPVLFDQRVASEFMEKVAVMAVYPFIREAIFTSASRLGLGPPVLGLLKQGEFKVNIVGTPSEESSE